MYVPPPRDPQRAATETLPTAPKLFSPPRAIVALRNLGVEASSKLVDVFQGFPP